MKRIFTLCAVIFITIGFTGCLKQPQAVTMNDLLDEMTSLKRLAILPGTQYKTVQFSSYDRRSTTPTDTLWFANEDGFGGEPVPGFIEVLKQPDSTGIGEYLICDIQNPGVIQRLWTAAITGKIRFYIDDVNTPVYEGDAGEFFWKPLQKLAGINDSAKYAQTFRQFDATYLPIPFAKRCRIEWIGNIKEPHFYHVGDRIYNKDVKVESFSAESFGKYMKKLEEVNHILANPDILNPSENAGLKILTIEAGANSAKEIFNLKGSGAIEYFRVKIEAENLENALRQTVLSITFDDAASPQVQAPLGDFFGAAPGLNPFQSLPFTVLPDSTMICRFVMPYKNSARIEIENHSTEKISLETTIKTTPYRWEEGKTMYFMARWKLSHRLTARNYDSGIIDINYLKATGSGRLAGAAAYLYNPCNGPVSWGNWWGEGDEKIFVDRDTFPSFFGTGSEDYFNYSWSSAMIFSYPYCGQPRNDGPGNRGYVSNFRWHIADDICFTEKLEFSMELRHHDVVPDFEYARIVYFYALPSLTDDYKKTDVSGIPEIAYLSWSPKAYLGSAGFSFIQAEKLAETNENTQTEKGKMWADENILTWKPKLKTEKLRFNIQSDQNKKNTRIGFTLAHSPNGGTLSFFLNGKPIRFDNKKTINLRINNRIVMDNHFSELVGLKKGNNSLVVEMTDVGGGKTAQFDFMWLK
jgi:hypothetical protein